MNSTMRLLPAKEMPPDTRRSSALRLQTQETFAGETTPGARQKDTQAHYIVYRSLQEYRGIKKPRIRVKKLLLPISAYALSFEGPGEYVKRSGATAYGTLVTYRHHVSAANVMRGGISYQLPARDATYRKVVELGQPATNVTLAVQPPTDARLLLTKGDQESPSRQ